MVWLCFPGMTSSLANHRCTLSDVFFYNILIFDVPKYSHIFHYIKDIRPAIYFDNQKIIAFKAACKVNSKRGLHIRIDYHKNCSHTSTKLTLVSVMLVWTSCYLVTCPTSRVLHVRCQNNCIFYNSTNTNSGQQT